MFRTRFPSSFPFQHQEIKHIHHSIEAVKKGRVDLTDEKYQVLYFTEEWLRFMCSTGDAKMSLFLVENESYYTDSRLLAWFMQSLMPTREMNILAIDVAPKSGSLLALEVINI